MPVRDLYIRRGKQPCEGVDWAAEMLDSGAAAEKLAEFVAFTQSATAGGAEGADA